MLKIVNQFWQYDTEEELNRFLDSCVNSNDEFLIERYGRAKNGRYYAYGSVVPATKFTKDVESKTDVKEELNLG